MAILKSDEQGFLVGELIENSREVLAGQERSMPVWRDIRRDVRSIARAMGVQVSSTRRSERSGSRNASGTGGRSAAGPSQRAASPTGRGSAAAAASPRTAGPRGAQRTAAAAAATVATRDARGRFVAGQGRGGAGALAADPAATPGAMASVAALANRIGQLTVAMQPAEGVDPALNAVREVQDVVAPLGRGLFAMFGRSAERKKERWYTRFWKALTARKDQPQQVVAGAGGGGMRLFGGLFPSLSKVLPFLGMIFTRILAPVAALWGSFEVGKWVGNKIYGWLESSGALGKLFDGVDWIKTTVANAWLQVTTKAGEAWQSITDKFDASMKWLGELPARVDAAIGRLPVVGKAYKETKNVVSQVGAGFTEGQGGKSDTPAPTGFVQNVARVVGSSQGRLIGGASNAGRLLAAGRGAGLSGLELANFMGQNAHESGGFTKLRENLNYSAAGLRKTFGKYYKTDAAARADAGNAEAIANRVYGGRMGNTEAGDGFKYRGRGFTQLTGKANYAAAGKALGLDLVNNPELAADPDNAARISAWYWKNRISSRGAGADITAATKLLNGGVNGLADRKSRAADWNARLAAGVTMPRTNMPTIPPAVPSTIPPPPEIQAPPTKLNGGRDKPDPIRVSLNEQTRQNVPDRSLAHIVSGGIGSG